MILNPVQTRLMHPQNSQQTWNSGSSSVSMIAGVIGVGGAVASEGTGAGVRGGRFSSRLENLSLVRDMK